MSDKVAVVAVAQTKFEAKRAEVNYAEMAYEVISRVLNDTGLDLGKDIDNKISCSHDIWDGQTISDIGITDVIGGHLGAEEKMAMDGSTAVFYGTVGILSGEYDLTLLLAHTKMSQTNRNLINNVAFEPIYTRMLGLDYTSAGALQARRYMYRYGITREQLSKVVVKNLANASLNPKAHRMGAYTAGQVTSSPLLASPLHALDVAPDTDGAVAMILASEKRAKELTDRPVWVRGIGVCYDAHYPGDRDLADCLALERAADQAYRMAGLKRPRREVDVVELGEEFSYQELLWLEGLGLCDRGEGGRMIDSGITGLKGKLPVNPSGGLLGGVPANVAGLNRVAEAVLQLRGEAGAHQVKNPKIAVAQGHSGFCGQHQCVIVLGNE
jgi:acetyl-CoA C-acetyltransferase